MKLDQELESSLCELFDGEKHGLGKDVVLNIQPVAEPYKMGKLLGILDANPKNSQQK